MFSKKDINFVEDRIDHDIEGKLEALKNEILEKTDEYLSIETLIYEEPTIH